MYGMRLMADVYGATSKDGVDIWANSQEEADKIATMTAEEYLGPKPEAKDDNK
jgi:hypothetical protein